MSNAVAKKVAADMGAASWIREMFEKGRRLKAELGEENVYDLSLGNPKAAPPEAFLDALQAVAAQRRPALHGYMAVACFKEALEFAKIRVVFKRPIAHRQTIQRRLADMCRRITTAQLLVLQLGRLKDQGSMPHSQVSMAKWNNVRMALDIARDARDILGAGGISVECCPIRHMLNLESVVTYEGTETIHELIIGRELIGQEAF
jgi:alkylation response protein AidB-like acyl-CoA dehydrogenase